MLSIFKKQKPKLSELIPTGFIDIHSHIIPNIDDGPNNLGDSEKIINAMEKLGFSKVIATPHTYPGLYDNSTYKIKKSFSRLDCKNYGLQIEYASEYMLDNSIIDKAKNKELLTLKENFVLVEMSFLAPPINLDEIIFYIKINGYIPVIAHPERYRFYFNKLNKFEILKEKGCKFQLNLLSTTGYYGKDVTKISDLLLENNLIDFVGSDIHSLNHVKKIHSETKIKNINNLERAIESNYFFN